MDRPATGPSLLDHFAALEDPRQRAKVLYPLPEILLLLLCATLAGADDVVEIALWGDEHLAFLRRFLPYRHGIPSHDTLGEVIAALDPAVQGLLRGAGSRACARRSPTSSRSTARPRAAPTPGARGAAPCTSSPPGRPASAWCSGRRRWRQVERDRRHPAPAGAARARRRPGHDRRHRHAGRDRRRTILRRGGDYLLALKENRPATFEDVEAFFADPPPGSLDTFETTDGDHGRIEVRRHAVCHDVAWLLSDRRYPGEVAFPGLAMIGMVESETERGGKVERERRYYLGSARLDAATFARAVRGHWGIENRLHWVLDVVFRTTSPGCGPATAREHGRGQAHGDEPAAPGERRPVSLKNRRKRAGWNTAYLESLIRQTA
jgi:hypothetical protein